MPYVETLPLGIWQSSDHTFFSNAVRDEAAMRSSCGCMSLWVGKSGAWLLVVVVVVRFVVVAAAGPGGGAGDFIDFASIDVVEEGALCELLLLTHARRVNFLETSRSGA